MCDCYMYSIAHQENSLDNVTGNASVDLHDFCPDYLWRANF